VSEKALKWRHGWLLRRGLEVHGERRRHLEVHDIVVLGFLWQCDGSMVTLHALGVWWGRSVEHMVTLHALEMQLEGAR